MTVIPPIHSTALHPIEFVPIIQDAETYKRLRVGENRKREQAAERVAAEIQSKSEAGTLAGDDLATALADLEADRTAISEQWGFIDRTFATMKKLYPTPQTFLISVPTTVEREQINSRLISLGLTQVTQEQIRATMIEELFHQDWSIGEEVLTSEQNQGRAEDHANFLDSVWLRQQAHDEVERQWREQEVERMVDEREGAPPRPAAPVPTKLIGVREQARMQLLVDRMMSQSQRLRDLAASNTDFGRRNAILLVRMHLVGVEGFEPAVPLERGKHTRALSEDSVLSLREQVDDASWNELVGYIDRLYQIDGGERKNSDSLLEKLPLLDGSTEPSVSPASSDGSSTISSSTLAPAAGSETIIDKSSGSTSASSTVADPTPPSSSQTAGD